MNSAAQSGGSVSREVEALREIVREGEKTSPNVARIVHLALRALRMDDEPYIRPADDPHTLVAKALDGSL